MNDQRFLWIDLETTGLNPQSCAILEIACFSTDTNLIIQDVCQGGALHHGA